MKLKVAPMNFLIALACTLLHENKAIDSKPSFLANNTCISQQTSMITMSWQLSLWPKV
jgi:hypothetical protein